MCGIFGVLVDQETPLQNGEIEQVMRDLLRLSQSRGKEASGVATYDTQSVTIRKRALPGRRFVRTEEWRELFDSLQKKNGDPLVCIGHARLDTNSSKKLEEENSPMRCGDVVGVHNGIIVNVDRMWGKYEGEVERTKQVVEPSGAASLAAVLGGRVAGERIGVVLSGGNVDAERFADLVGTDGRG